MRKRCLFGITDDLQAYAERATAKLLGTVLDPEMVSYGPVNVGLLHRAGNFQTELVRVAPNARLPVHRHPGVDTIECPVAGLMRFEIEGVDPYRHIPNHRLERFQQGKLLRIDAQAWHAGTAGPRGADFLSMQRWPAGTPLTLLGERWEGSPMSEHHGRALGAGRFQTVPATVEHARYVGERLRPEEVAELWALAQAQPVPTAVLSIERSERAWAWLVDGLPAALFGVASRNLMGDRGEPWLLTTTVVDEHPVRFLRSCSIAIRHMKAAYPVLENWVDARHTVCVRWLKWLGFTVHAPEPHGVLGLPFHRFEFHAGGHGA